MSSNGYTRTQSTQHRQRKRVQPRSKLGSHRIVNRKIYNEVLLLEGSSNIRDIQILPVSKPFGLYFMLLAVTLLYVSPTRSHFKRTLWNWTGIAPLALSIVIFMVRTVWCTTNIEGFDNPYRMDHNSEIPVIIIRTSIDVQTLQAISKTGRKIY